MSATAYAAWVERVFAALVAVHEANPLSPGVSLTTLAEHLGLGRLTLDDYARHDDPGEAVLDALADLNRLELVKNVQVVLGNAISQLGRTVIDHGFDVVRSGYHEGLLSPTERTLLARLLIGSFRSGEGWVRLAPIDPEPVWIELWPGDDPDVSRLKLERLLGDLEDTDYVSRRDRPLVRLTYVAAVALSQPDPSVALGTGLIDWSFSERDWSAIEDRIKDLKLEIQAAATLDDLQDVGRRCREIAMDAMELVFDPSMVPEGKPAPSPRDAKRLLELYLARRAPGGKFEEYRSFLNAALGLANAQVRAGTLAAPGAVASAQGLLSFVRALQFLDRTTRGSDPDLA